MTVFLAFLGSLKRMFHVPEARLPVSPVKAPNRKMTEEWIQTFIVFSFTDSVQMILSSDTISLKLLRIAKAIITFKEWQRWTQMWHRLLYRTSTTLTPQLTLSVTRNESQGYELDRVKDSIADVSSVSHRKRWIWTLRANLPYQPEDSETQVSPDSLSRTSVFESFTVPNLPYWPTQHTVSFET